MVDLNDFKSINERFGHSGGMSCCGTSAEPSAPPCGSRTPWPGSAATSSACSPETGREDAARLEERLRPAIQRATGGFEDLSGSVGCAVFPDDGTTPAEVMAAADAAQAEDKRRARVRDGRAPARSPPDRGR
jgi:GGDEF domain-containing protein